MEDIKPFSPIIPPTEYPISFDITILEDENSSEEAHWEYVNLNNAIEYETHNTSLQNFLNQIKHFYNDFLNAIPEIDKSLFPSYRDILSLLEDINKTSKEGDIIKIEISDVYYFYVSGYRNNRNIVIIPYYVGYLSLPKEALNGIKIYNIHELRDLQRLYKMKNIRWIRIPREYYPEELTIDENEIPFKLKNKENYSIVLDIGNGYELYVSPDPNFSSYFEKKFRLR